MAVLTILAIDARRDAERQRIEAERQRGEAEGLVEFMLTDLRDRLKGVGRLDVLTAVNQRALDHYARQDLKGLPPESLERRARILHAMGEDDETRGELGRALAEFRQAARTTAALLAAKPNDPTRVFSDAQSRFWIGHIAEKRGDSEAAFRAYRGYREQAQRLNRLVPNDPKYVGEMAYAESNLGSVLLGMARPPEARKHFRRGLEYFVRAAKMEPNNELWTVKAANAHAWLADSWFTEKRYPEARAEHVKEKNLKQKLLNREPGNLTHQYALAITTRSLARIAVEQREYHSAESSLLSARLTMKRLRAVDADNLVWRDQATLVEADLADLFRQTGRIAASREALGEAKSLFAGRPTEPSLARGRVYARLESVDKQLQVQLTK
jgi:tetratricopeptide (TPR) repeat protein